MLHTLAYLDPGTGSFFLQLLVGSAFGGLLMLKHFWRQVKSFFTRKPQPRTSP